MKRYTYYPGCSVKGTGRAYEESLLAVFDALGIELNELDDWNCCGATAYMAIDELQAMTLSARNLALAAEQGVDIVTPCNACYLALNKTRRGMESDAPVRERIDRALKTAGLQYQPHIAVRHPLDVLINDIGIDSVKEKVTHPLDGLKIAPYYGCQIVRPYADFDDQDDPSTMDRLLTASGATVVEYPFKTRCCGGSQTGTIPEAGLHLVDALLCEAERRGARAIATVCPLCQFNLDVYQSQLGGPGHTYAMPILYVTQVLGLAMGLPPERLGMHRQIVSADPIIERRTADVS